MEFTVCPRKTKWIMREMIYLGINQLEYSLFALFDLFCRGIRDFQRISKDATVCAFGSVSQGFQRKPFGFVAKVTHENYSFDLNQQN